MRVLHGQGFDLGGLLLTAGLALGLGPGLATLVSLAVGLSLGLLAAGGRAEEAGWPRIVGAVMAVPSQRKEKARRGEGSAGPPREAVCGGGGSDESQLTVANGNHAIAGRSHRVGVTSDEAENAPRLRVCIRGRLAGSLSHQ